MSYSYVFNTFKQVMYSPGYNFAINHGIQVSLVGAGFVDGSVFEANKFATSWSALSIYAVPGVDAKSLTNISETLDYSGGIKIVADDVIWSLSNVSGAYGAVFYDMNNMPICYLDFGGSWSTQNGTFKIPTSNGFIYTP